MHSTKLRTALHRHPHRQVVDPKIKAFMYTWGEGRVTAEGEQIPGAPPRAAAGPAARPARR